MKCFDDNIKLIETHEETDVAFVKVGDGAKKLIVSFASIKHSGFERKESLLNLRCTRNNEIDILYMRNIGRWYLGGLNGIGKNITHTIAFLKKEFAKYENVVCTGISMGGYASILFGSVCNATSVVASMPQTDLDYAIAMCQPNENDLDNQDMRKCQIKEPALASFGKSKVITFKSYETYKNLRTVINDTTQYYIYPKRDKFPNLHGLHHYTNISKFDNVTKVLTQTKCDKLLFGGSLI